MIKVSLSRDEIEEALIEYAKDMLSSQMLVNHDIKITQGKSASATVVLVPKGTSKEKADEAVSQAEKEIETVAGQPDQEPTETPIPAPAATVNGFH